MIISQKKIFNIIFNEKPSTIKTYVARIRLKFNKFEISQYLWAIYIHANQQKRFKNIYKNWYKNNKYKFTYQNFMKNIILFAPLWRLIFLRINEKLDIKPSKLLNIVDTTLVAKKQDKYITQKDFNKKLVTKRSKIHLGKSISYYICGIKILVFLNRFGKIYYARILNINYSDQNIFKDSALYLPYTKGFLLADRGFSNNNVRKRVNTNDCKLVSPVHYKQNNFNGNVGNFISSKEKKLYRKRWQIETVFQKLKDKYQDFKLDCTGVRNKKLVEAKVFISLTKYNSTKN